MRNPQTEDPHRPLEPPEAEADDNVGTGGIRPMDRKELLQSAERLTEIAYEVLGLSLKLRETGEKGFRSRRGST